MPSLHPALILACCLLVSSSVVAAPPVIPAEVKTRIQQRVDNGYTPGIVVCMINGDGCTCYSYGKMSHQPGAFSPDETTLYEIASVTKTFTTVLLAQMVEAGDVSLSDTVGSFLPAGVMMPANGGDTITLEQLANHSSGLPNTPDNLPATITDFANQFENYSMELLYDFLAGYSLPRAPGAAYEYSNLAIGLLGHVLALSQGSDYESLLRQRVLGPMGLSDTTVTLSEFQKSRTAPGHHGVVQRPPFEMNSLRAAGGLKSCAYDLTTYLAYNLGIQSGPISSALALSHQLSYDLPNASYGYDQGLGWWLFEGGDVVQHGGDSFGSTAFIGMKKSTNTGVVVLSNNRAHYPASIGDLGFHCLDQSNALLDIPTTTPVSEATLRAITGDYGTFRIEVINGRPVLSIPGQLSYTAYDNRNGGLSTLDIGLAINMDFNTDPGSGDVSSVSYSQNGGAVIEFARIRHDATLSISMGGGENPIQLEVQGEGDRDYPLEFSTDLKNWQPLGTIDIWSPRGDPGSAAQKYFRICEP